MLVDIRTNKKSDQFINDVLKQDGQLQAVMLLSYIADLVASPIPYNSEKCIRLNESDDCCYAIEKGDYIITYAFPYTKEEAPLGTTYLLITSIAYPLQCVEETPLLERLFGKLQDVIQTIRDGAEVVLKNSRKTR